MKHKCKVFKCTHIVRIYIVQVWKCDQKYYINNQNQNTINYENKLCDLLAMRM